MTSGRNDRLWGDMGVMSVQGTLGATMEPGNGGAVGVAKGLAGEKAGVGRGGWEWASTP